MEGDRPGVALGGGVLQALAAENDEEGSETDAIAGTHRTRRLDLAMRAILNGTSDLALRLHTTATRYGRHSRRRMTLVRRGYPQPRRTWLTQS